MPPPEFGADLKCPFGEVNFGPQTGGSVRFKVDIRPSGLGSRKLTPEDVLLNGMRPLGAMQRRQPKNRLRGDQRLGCGRVFV